MDFDGDDDVDLQDEAIFGMILEDEAEEEEIARRRYSGRGGGRGCTTLALGLIAAAILSAVACFS